MNTYNDGSGDENDTDDDNDDDDEINKSLTSNNQ